MKTKILMLGRHGKAPKLSDGASEDKLVDETIPVLWDIGESVQEYDMGDQFFQPSEAYSPNNTFLVHSNAKRTRLTGEAFLSGVFGYEKPETVEDLAKLDFSDVMIEEDSRLNLREPHGNMTIYKAHGAGPCIDYWLANPEATEHDGEKIAPYTVIRENTRASAVDTIGNLVNDKGDLGVLVTHTSMIEPVIIALVNSGREYPVEKVEEIGGTFDMAEFAKLTIEESGGIYKAKLSLKDKEYKVDLDQI